jgi:hypothetical protein
MRRLSSDISSGNRKGRRNGWINWKCSKIANIQNRL